MFLHLSLHKTLQTALKLDALNEWSSVVALTYIAAQRVFPHYNDMGDAKSLLESITRSFGYHYGMAKKVRSKHHFSVAHCHHCRQWHKRVSTRSITMPMSCRLLAMPLPMNAQTTPL
jgi:hypothetical protein